MTIISIFSKTDQISTNILWLSSIKLWGEIDWLSIKASGRDVTEVSLRYELDKIDKVVRLFLK